MKWGRGVGGIKLEQKRNIDKPIYRAGKKMFHLFDVILDNLFLKNTALLKFANKLF